jgi:hypothetical protein
MTLPFFTALGWIMFEKGQVLYFNEHAHMVNLIELERDLLALAKKKNELSSLGYDDTRYDEVEEALHDLEDEFQETYGDYLEDALHAVHDDLCPDNDVLLPIAYVANRYIVSEDGRWLPAEGGVPVEVDELPNKGTKLAIAPSPTRIVLMISPKKQEDVWMAK